MRIVILNLLLSLAVSSCVGQDSLPVYFERNGYEGTFTLRATLTKNELSDDVFEVHYLFKGANSESTFILPTLLNEIVGHVHLIEVKSFEIKDRKVQVYKFLQDDPAVEDDEMLYFYTQIHGIIVKRSGSWKYEERLIDLGDKSQNNLIAELYQQVKSDAEFFQNWR